MMRVDTCWSVSVGLGVVDTMRGAVFQTEHAIEALNAGELHRAARAMTMESVYTAVHGSSTRRKTAELFRYTKELVDRADTPHARGLFLLCDGIAAALDGRWRRGADACRASEQVLLDGCTGVTWEIDSGRFFSFYCHYFLGEMKIMATRYPLLVHDAEERGDLYALTMFRGLHSHFIHLCDDDPAGGCEVSDDAIRRWSQAGSHIHHMWGLWAASDLAIYERRGLLAWAKGQTGWGGDRVDSACAVQKCEHARSARPLRARGDGRRHLFRRRVAPPAARGRARGAAKHRGACEGRRQGGADQ